MRWAVCLDSFNVLKVNCRRGKRSRTQCRYTKSMSLTAGAKASWHSLLVQHFVVRMGMEMEMIPLDFLCHMLMNISMFAGDTGEIKPEVREQIDAKVCEWREEVSVHTHTHVWPSLSHLTYNKTGFRAKLILCLACCLSMKFICSTLNASHS